MSAECLNGHPANNAILATWSQTIGTAYETLYGTINERGSGTIEIDKEEMMLELLRPQILIRTQITTKYCNVILAFWTSLSEPSK